ncbi:homoserine kinase, partial [bacterium]|nr:homoserine kinase [bacterium]
GDDGRLPLDSAKNTAGVAVRQLLAHIELDQGFDIELHKKMPLGSGLGSSAASAAAGAFAANEILGRPLTRKELLPFAMAGEKAACGVAHADNAAPALFGGFVLIRSYDPLDVIPIPTPPDLYCSVVHPHIEIRTEDARKILRQEIQIKKAIQQWGNVAGLVAGLMQSDYELIGRSLQDVIIEPVRSILIPGFAEIKAAAINAGALGASISGSGPSLFALSTSKRTARKVGAAMQQEFSRIGIDSDIHISTINQQGPKIIKSE